MTATRCEASSRRRIAISESARMAWSSKRYSFPQDTNWHENGGCASAQLLGLIACASVAAAQSFAGCYVYALLVGAELSLAVYAVATMSAAGIGGMTVAALVQGSDQ